MNHEFVGTFSKPWINIDTEGYNENPKIEIGTPYMACINILSELLNKNYSYYVHTEVINALVDLHAQIGIVLKDDIRYNEFKKHFSSQISVKKQENKYGF